MPTGVLIGIAAGAVIGWIISAVFSKGPKTPMQAFTGEYESGGAGCIGFLVLVGLGAAIGGVIGAVISG